MVICCRKVVEDVREALGTDQELPDNQKRPSFADNVQGMGNRAVLAVASLTQISHLFVTISLVIMCGHLMVSTKTETQKYIL